MKMRIGFCLLFLSALSVPALWADEWQTNYDNALAAAKSENKRVLLDFTGSDWCGPCIALNKKVFTQQEFRDYAAKNLILVEVDYPKRKELAEALKQQNEKLMKQYGIDGFPTIIVLGPDGKIAGRFTGYGGEGPAEFIAKIDKLRGS